MKYQAMGSIDISEAYEMEVRPESAGEPSGSSGFIGTSRTPGGAYEV